MKSLLLVLLLASAAAAQSNNQPTPKVTGLMLCQKIDPPPDAKPNTTTLSCHRETTRILADLQPEAFEIPETFATFAGKNFVVELLDNGHRRFAIAQPAGNAIEYSPPCPRKRIPAIDGYDLKPLQHGPCNPELKP